jgi:hypothetical protein
VCDVNIQKKQKHMIDQLVPNLSTTIHDVHSTVAAHIPSLSTWFWQTAQLLAPGQPQNEPAAAPIARAARAKAVFRETRAGFP